MTICTIPNDAALEQAKTYLKSQGVTLSSTQLLELTARLHGYANLSTMNAADLPTDAPAPAEETLARVCMQYEVATGESGDDARTLIARIGLEAALERWTNELELVIGLGPYVVRAESATGFWNEHQGWVFDKRSATGYQKDGVKDLPGLQHDAELVEYESAVDFPADEPARAS